MHITTLVETHQNPPRGYYRIAESHPSFPGFTKTPCIIDAKPIFSRFANRPNRTKQTTDTSYTPPIRHDPPDAPQPRHLHNLLVPAQQDAVGRPRRLARRAGPRPDLAEPPRLLGRHRLRRRARGRVGRGRRRGRHALVSVALSAKSRDYSPREYYFLL